MPANAAELWATIRARLDSLKSDITKGLDGLGPVFKATGDDLEAKITAGAQAAGQAVTTYVGDAGVQAAASLGQIGSGAWIDRVVNAAKQAGASTEQAFGASAEIIRQRLGSAADGVAERYGVEGAQAGSEFSGGVRANADVGAALDPGDVSSKYGSEGSAAGSKFASEVKSEVGAVSDALGQEGDSGGAQFSAGFIAKLGAIAGAGAKVGGELVMGILGALGDVKEGITESIIGGQDVDRQMAFAFQGTPDIAAAAADAATNVYRSAWGDSMGEVGDTVQNAIRNFPTADATDIEQITSAAFAMSQVFGVDVSQAVDRAGQLMRTGLAGDGLEAVDLLTAGLADMPISIRDELFEATGEYGKFFADLGFNGQQAVGLLSAAAQDGVFGIDKTGDAVKEFGIRATDMSATSKVAFDTLGLSQQDMANQLLAGGETAQGAFQQIVSGLLGIEDPALRANTAIALFGTPIEDIGVNKIPDFLASLANAGGTVSDFAGQAAALGESTTSLGSQFESFKRNALGGLADFIESTVLPGVTSIREAFMNTFSGGDVSADGFLGVVERIGAGVRTVIDWVTENGPRIGEALSSGWESIQGGWEEHGRPVFEAVMEFVSGVVDMVSNEWPQIEETISSVMDTVGTVVGDVLDFISGAWDGFGDNIQAAINGPFKFVIETIKSGMEVIKGIFETVAGILTGDWSRAWEGLKGIVSGVFSNIVSTIQMYIGNVGNLLAAAGKVILAGFGLALSGLGSLLSTIWTGITTGLSTALAAIPGLLAGLGTLVLGALAALPGLVVGALAALPGLVGGVITTVISTAVGILGGLVEQVVAVLLGLPAAAAAAIASLPQVIGAVFTLIVDTVVPAVAGLIATVVTTLGGLVVQAAGAIAGLPGAIGGVLIEAATAAASEAASLVTQAAAAIGNLVTSGPAAIAGLAGAIGGKIIEAATSAVTEAGTLVTNTASKIGELATEAPAKIVGLTAGIVGKITEAAGLALTAAGALVSDVAGKIGELPGRAISALAGLAGAVKDKVLSVLKSGVNLAIDAINAVSPSISVLGVNIGVPDLPHIARGAIFQPRPGGQVINVAEAGFAEAVISTDPRLRDRSLSLMDQAGLSALVMQRALAGGDGDQGLPAGHNGPSSGQRAGAGFQGGSIEVDALVEAIGSGVARAASEHFRRMLVAGVR